MVEALGIAILPTKGITKLHIIIFTIKLSDRIFLQLYVIM